MPGGVFTKKSQIARLTAGGKRVYYNLLDNELLGGEQMTPAFEPEKSVGGQLMLLTRLMHRRMEAVRAASGADCATAPQGWLMNYLYDRRAEDIFQRDIERRFHLRRSSVTGILQNMEKAGLIVREAVESDARLKRIRLTERGAAQHEAIVRGIEQNERDLTAGFTPAEIETLRGLLTRMRQNMQTEQDPKEETEAYAENPAQQCPRV